MRKLAEWFDRLMYTSAPRSPEDVAAEVDEGVQVIEFVPWPKTCRYFRDIVVTEKIDGTNAAVVIEDVTDEDAVADDSVTTVVVLTSGRVYAVGAQSRNRVITPANDNQGFAKWVRDNAGSLVDDLGSGRHYGEFWGGKIARKYGLAPDDKRFSLFNPTAAPREWADLEAPSDAWRTPGLSTVPALYEGPHSTEAIRQCLADLRDFGSKAAPGYMNPEGVVVYHTHARKIIGKVTLDNQDAGKWEAQS